LGDGEKAKSFPHPSFITGSSESLAEELGMQHRDVTSSPAEITALIPSRKAPTALCKIVLLVFGQDKGMHYQAVTSASCRETFKSPESHQANATKTQTKALLLQVPVDRLPTTSIHGHIHWATGADLCLVLLAKLSSPRTQRGAQRF
jgi:hypothetical protein